MRPEANAQNILSTTRATAKMHEFRVAPEDFIDLPRDPAILFALAIGILGDVAAGIADKIRDETEIQGIDLLPVPLSWGTKDPAPIEGLRFASVFFDAFLNSRLDQTITTEFSLLCASAYYLAGNVGSAAVIVRHMVPPPLELAGGLGRLAYAILRNDYKAIQVEHTHSDFTTNILGKLIDFMRFECEAVAVIEKCNVLRNKFYKDGASRELLYSDLVTAICAHKLRNAARTILPIASGLDPDIWRPALAKPHFPIELWPAQQRIADAELLVGKSAVIQMPTSAGKTRATELIIRSAFLSKRASLAVIVAPYRSLCHDIRGDLATAFANEAIRLDEASDSYQFDLVLDALFVQESVLIVTPEKLLYMLRRAPELAGQIGLVIYDEGHQFEGMTRGPTYELLLTSLRMTLAKETQIVLISAVIGNAADVAAWLIGDSEAVVGGEGLLPTPKSIAFASWQGTRGSLEYVSPQDPDDREFFVPRVLTDTLLARKPRERTDKRFPDKSSGGDIGLFLGLHVVNNGSVAIFSGRKDSVTKICKRAVEIFDRGIALQRPIAMSDAAEVEKIRALSEAHLGADASATHAAALGVFAHHADTPHGLRLAIEYAMKENLAKFVVCTSTLAQGVNFPLRYLIVTSTRQGGEKILVRDFHNLMGRAGRAGMHTEGSVIFSTPAIFDQRTQFRGRYQWAAAKELLDPANSEPTTSSILAIFDDYEQRQKDAPPIMQEILPEWLDLAFADRDRIEAVVQAALALQPNISAKEFRRFIEGRARAVQSIAAFLVSNMIFSDGDDIAVRVDELASNTLAYHLADEGTRARLVEVFRAIATSVVENTDGDQRAIIRRSPLPPAAVADLQAWLTANLGDLIAAVEEGRLLDAVTATILGYSSARSIRALSDATILPHVLGEWVAGRSFAFIFNKLRAADIRVGRDRSTVEDTVALCEGGFGYDVAMIVASLADLVEPLETNVYTAMSLLQRQVKHGLTDKAAITFLESGFADRHVASMLALAWPDVVDRAGVRSICRNDGEAVRAVLAGMPSYFTTVAVELGV